MFRLLNYLFIQKRRKKNIDAAFKVKFIQIDDIIFIRTIKFITMHHHTFRAEAIKMIMNSI